MGVDKEIGRRARARRPRETNGHPRAGSPLMDRSWRACPTATSRFTLGNSQVSRSDGTPFAGCHHPVCAATYFVSPLTCVVPTPFAIGPPKGPSFCYAPVSYTHLRAHETVLDLVCRLLLEKKKKKKPHTKNKH